MCYLVFVLSHLFTIPDVGYERTISISLKYMNSNIDIKGNCHSCFSVVLIILIGFSIHAFHVKILQLPYFFLSAFTFQITVDSVAGRL